MGSPAGCAHPGQPHPFAPGTKITAPPGVTLTSTSGTSATGYLTNASGAAFATGLRAIIGTNVAARRPAGSGALFGDLASMALASTATTSPGTIEPHYVMHTLQIDATDTTGAPAYVLAVLLNTDSANSENTLVPVDDGIGRVEVPAGDYALAAIDTTYDTLGNPTSTRIVIDNAFTVPDTAGATTTAQLDEETATSASLISGRTPRPSTPQYTLADWTRTDSTGAGTLVASWGSLPTYVNPQPGLRRRLRRTSWCKGLGQAGPATGPQYRYDAAFDGTSIPADQTYTVQPDQLAVVHQDFYTDPAAAPTTDTFQAAALDSNTAAFVVLPDITEYSGPVTDYVGTADGGTWVDGVQTPSQVSVVGDARTYAPGHAYADDWSRGPLAPNLGQYADPFRLQPVLLRLCAAGGDLDDRLQPARRQRAGPPSPPSPRGPRPTTRLCTREWHGRSSTRTALTGPRSRTSTGGRGHLA